MCTCLCDWFGFGFCAHGNFLALFLALLGSGLLMGSNRPPIQFTIAWRAMSAASSKPVSGVLHFGGTKLTDGQTLEASRAASCFVSPAMVAFHPWNVMRCHESMGFPLRTNRSRSARPASSTAVQICPNEHAMMRIVDARSAWSGHSSKTTKRMPRNERSQVCRTSVEMMFPLHGHFLTGIRIMSTIEQC